MEEKRKSFLRGFIECTSPHLLGVKPARGYGGGRDTKGAAGGGERAGRCKRSRPATNVLARLKRETGKRGPLRGGERGGRGKKKSKIKTGDQKKGCPS